MTDRESWSPTYVVANERVADHVFGVSCHGPHCAAVVAASVDERFGSGRAIVQWTGVATVENLSHPDMDGFEPAQCCQSETSVSLPP